MNSGWRLSKSLLSFNTQFQVQVGKRLSWTFKVTSIPWFHYTLLYLKIYHFIFILFIFYISLLKCYHPNVQAPSYSLCPQNLAQHYIVFTVIQYFTIQYIILKINWPKIHIVMQLVEKSMISLFLGYLKKCNMLNMNMMSTPEPEIESSLIC